MYALPYFTRGLRYEHKMFMKSTTGGSIVPRYVFNLGNIKKVLIIQEQGQI
jgi:hypothetical protein